MLITIDNRTIELSDEQVTAFHSLTRLQQGMALGTLEGLSPADSHRRAGGKSRNEENRTRLAGEILRNPSVDSFVNSFKVETTKRLADLVMSRDEMLERLSSIARTNIDDVISLHNNPLIDEETGEVVAQAGWSFKETSDMTGAGTALISELTAGKDGLKIKTHSQIAAMKQIAELQGYNKPQQVEVTGAVATNVTPQQVLDFKKAFNESF